MKTKSLKPSLRPAWMERGELPSADMRGITKQAKALKDKFRSPIAFCRTRPKP